MCHSPQPAGPGCALLFLSLGLLTGCVTPSDPHLVYQAMVQHQGDRIEIQQDGSSAAFLVTSPSGIGGATLTLWQGVWPKDVRVRLRYAEGRPYTRLESFTCAVGSKAPVEIGAVEWHPEYAEVDLAAGGLRSTARTVQLQWVDAYRQ